jgi:hypothetical protein
MNEYQFPAGARGTALIGERRINVVPGYGTEHASVEAMLDEMLFGEDEIMVAWNADGASD